jgi:hypothetical protein
MNKPNDPTQCEKDTQDSPSLPKPTEVSVPAEVPRFRVKTRLRASKAAC